MIITIIIIIITIKIITIIIIIMIIVHLKKYEWLNLVDVVHAIADNTCKARFPEKIRYVSSFPLRRLGACDESDEILIKT